MEYMYADKELELKLFGKMCLTLPVNNGNPDRASQRWRAYSEQSVVGSGVRSAIAASQGNMQEAHRLGVQMGIATARATISAVGVGVVAAAVVAGGPAADAVAGAVVGVADTAAQGAISGQ